MEIQYLIKMKNTPKIGSFENKGISEIEIEKLEKEMKIKFPVAYKEFLYLGGKREFIIGDWTTESQYLDWMQRDINESMQNVNLNLKPFFAFASYDRDQFLFFFLDEGDNPPVYTYDEMKIHKDEQGNPAYYKKTKASFVEFIEKHIEQALKK